MTEVQLLSPPPFMSESIKAPWTPEQVSKLNEWQTCGHVHPFTCGGERGDVAHIAYSLSSNQMDEGVLVATESGWVCPACSYKQDWAHDFMFTGCPSMHCNFPPTGGVSPSSAPGAKPAP